MSRGGIRPAQPFPEAAKITLVDAQLRKNLGHATKTIREKRLRAISEIPNWEELRDEVEAAHARTASGPEGEGS